MKHRHRTRLGTLFAGSVFCLVVLLLVAACSSDDDAAGETTTTASPSTISEATTTTAAPTTTAASSTMTTATSTTTTTATPVREIDEAVAADFVVTVRDSWDLTERTVGGTAPVLSDEEILAIAGDICDYVAANPVPVGKEAGPRMEAYGAIAVIISDAMGIPYDPTLLDAGFDSEVDSRNVTAFKSVIERDSLCPSDSGLNEHLFFSPWSAKASAQDS